MKDAIFYELPVLLPFGMKDLQDLYQLASGLPTSERMPLLFLGHGSPMNDIEENIFVEEFIGGSLSMTSVKIV